MASLWRPGHWPIEPLHWCHVMGGCSQAWNDEGKCHILPFSPSPQQVGDWEVNIRCKWRLADEYDKRGKYFVDICRELDELTVILYSVLGNFLEPKRCLLKLIYTDDSSSEFSLYGYSSLQKYLQTSQERLQIFGKKLEYWEKTQADRRTDMLRMYKPHTTTRLCREQIVFLLNLIQKGS